MNDFHWNSTYNETCKFGNCQDNGVFGKDPPLKLITTVVEKAASEFQDKEPDVVFLLGDFIEHDMDPDPENGFTWEDKYKLIINTWTTVISVVKNHFPNTPIISTFGNNDNFRNYLPTRPDDPDWGGKLFEDSWKIWMEGV